MFSVIFLLLNFKYMVFNLKCNFLQLVWYLDASFMQYFCFKVKYFTLSMYSIHRYCEAKSEHWLVNISLFIVLKHATSLAKKIVGLQSDITPFLRKSLFITVVGVICLKEPLNYCLPDAYNSSEPLLWQCLLLQGPSHQDFWVQIRKEFCSIPSLTLVLKWV